MLTAVRRHFIHRHFRATRNRQTGRAWWVKKPEKPGYLYRSERAFSVTSRSITPQFSNQVIKKYLLAVIGKVSARASRIQDKECLRSTQEKLMARRPAYKKIHYVRAIYNPNTHPGASFGELVREALRLRATVSETKVSMTTLGEVAVRQRHSQWRQANQPTNQACSRRRGAR
ncbi:MAG: hypothetical protein U5L98_06440 [Halomonas sp.]|uniref:hypothetical protein n=1 Tax=Halomonas sp. TaxID=1486246 RepID=UPI002ACD89BB|nr:hypothetical protein [Halomonas sp.]MDZ7852283.1 hypothetical protein [Halomonas sp.]